MHSSLVDADTILALEVGTCNTRALLFDVVEGSYRLVATGKAPSTASAPVKDVVIGLVQAIKDLQTITGRSLLDAESAMIIPSRDGAGVDSVVAAISAGPALKTVVVGMLGQVSLESAIRLARTNLNRVVKTISLNDGQSTSEQVDALIRLEPDLVIMAGGTDGGASLPLLKMAETIALACQLTSAEKRPAVLFSGNSSAAEELAASLKPLTSGFVASLNIRPSIDRENLQPASRDLADLTINSRRSRLKGVDDLYTLTSGNLVTASYAQANMIRFLGKSCAGNRGILGVDVGASAISITAACKDDSCASVFPQFGLGESLNGFLKQASLEELLRWIPDEIPMSYLRDYVYHKATFPESLPATQEDQNIELAITRILLELSMCEFGKGMPAGLQRLCGGSNSHYEPILVSGSVICDAPTVGQGLLTVLDGIQPAGVTTIIFDRDHLLPGLGAAVTSHPVLPVQIIDSGVFSGAASVVVPVSLARPGTVILEGSLVTDDGTESKFEVTQGSLEILPVPNGQLGRLKLHPLHKTDVGFGTGHPGEMQVGGTRLGVVIDARGRPVQLPREDGRRRETLKKWLWTLGG